MTQKGAFEYSLSQKYLLFLSKNSAETAAMVSLGKFGVFRVQADDDGLEAINGEVTPLKRDLEQRHANKIDRLRTSLKERH